MGAAATEGRAAMGAAAGGAAWHALAPGEVLALLGSCEAGLPEAEAAARRARLGPNALPEPPRRSGLRLFAAQFASPLIALLLAAAGLALLLGERRDAAVIAGVLLVNAFVGWFQESRAQRSMEALRRLAALRVTALRAGVERVLDARDLVPGDVVRLAAGDAVAADARLLSAARLEAIEAALTGESAPSRKQVAAVGAGAPPADRRDMVFAGTHLAGGRGTAVVVATGVATRLPPSFERTSAT